MQRGRYGIEYEPSDSRAARKLLQGLFLVPVALVAFLIYRGCDGDVSPARIAGEDTIKLGVEEERAEDKNVLKKILDVPKTPPPPKPVAQPVKPEEPKPVAAPAGNVTVSDALQREISEADTRVRQDDLLGARAKLLSLLKRPEAKGIGEYLEKKVSVINEKLLYSNRPMPGKITYTVVAGDSLGKIARKFNTTIDFIIAVNNIEKPSQLSIGRELWVLNNPIFELTIEKKKFTAVLTLNGEFFKRYTIGLGPEADIPSGIYSLRSRFKNPVYRKAGQKALAFGAPGNILGTSLLTLSAVQETPPVAGLSLHGTWVNASLGCRNEDGRVRFRNADIEQLTRLLPIGTAVNICD